MKAIIISSLFIFSVTNLIHSQNTGSAIFGGESFINVGNEFIDNTRTIEVRFRLKNFIDPELDNFQIVLCRESNSNSNLGEFNLLFQKNGLPNAGSLRFDIDGTKPYKSIYSDKNHWEKDVWYHVAVVIDPYQGMSMYIDGELQNSKHPYKKALLKNEYDVTIGGTDQKSIGNRGLVGQIDFVRFSHNISEPDIFMLLDEEVNKYAANAVWRFNESNGKTTVFEEISKKEIGHLKNCAFSNSIKRYNPTPIDQLENFTSDYITIYPITLFHIVYQTEILRPKYKNEDLNWYSIFLKDNVFSVKKSSIFFMGFNEDMEQAASVGGQLLYLGSNGDIREGYYGEWVKKDLIEQFRYSLLTESGLEKGLPQVNLEINMHAIGSTEDTNSNKSMRFLTKNLQVMPTSETIDLYNKAQILWAGDLNLDGYNDILIRDYNKASCVPSRFLLVCSDFSAKNNTVRYYVKSRFEVDPSECQNEIVCKATIYNQKFNAKMAKHRKEYDDSILLYNQCLDEMRKNGCEGNVQFKKIEWEINKLNELLKSKK